MFLRLIGVLLLMTPWTFNCVGQQEHSRESHRQAALAFEQAGKVAEAEAEWRSLLSSQPTNSETYAHLGLLEARQAHYKEAIALYRKALSLNPKMPSLRFNLGLSLFKSGDMRAAIEVFEPLLKSEPDSPEALRLVTLLGMAHYRMGDYAASVPYLEQASAANPGNLNFRMMLAQSFLRSKQYRSVLDIYREILTINSESAEADMVASEVNDEMKNDGEALAGFEAAVKADPAMSNVHFCFGYLLWKGLNFAEAESEFRSELANNPEHPFALAYLGDTEMRLDHFDAAVPYLERAVRIRPSIAIAHLDLGITYDGQGRKDDALRELKAAERLSPDAPSIHYRLGQFYESMDRKAEAKAEFDITRNLQQAKMRSFQVQMRQAEPKPAGQNVDIGPK